MTLREELEPATDRWEQVQPEYYKQFRCLADACPDTCCEGWRVGIDKQTYDKYQQSSDPVLRPAFQQLVTIDPARTTDDQYATLANFQGRCGFLSEGLCSIQKRLGESYLGAACASFPRVTNLVSGMLERSLDLSCPEAARLALLNPTPLRFEVLERERNEGHAQVAEPSPGRVFDGAFLGAGLQKSEEAVRRVRKLVWTVLQNRKYPVAKRLILLGHVCDKLTEITRQSDYQSTQAVLEGFAGAIDSGLFDEHLIRCQADAGTQLGIVMELIGERVRSDFTQRRFLELYQEFLNGIHCTPNMTVAEASVQYEEAYRLYYSPLLSQHEYVLENYLVNNAFKTMFPFGSRSLSRTLNLEPAQAITGQYMLMTTYFAIAKAMLIGVAGAQGSAFNLEAVVKTLQISSKTVEHSITYPQQVLKILAGNGITNAAGMVVLTQN